MFVEIIIWIFFGGLAGFTTKWILPAKHEPQGCLLVSLVGVFGAVSGGFLGKKTVGNPIEQPDYITLLCAIAGGLIVSILFQILVSRK